MPDRIFRSTHRFALADSGTQWVLLRREGEQWHAVSFVQSTKYILARCMREKGASTADSEVLLEGLPDTYAEWKALRAPKEAR